MKIILCIRQLLLAVAFAVVPLAYGHDNEQSSNTRIAVQASPARTYYAQANVKSGNTKNLQVNLDALVQSAKAEGGLTIYVAFTGLGERVVEGFGTKYGIKAQFLRMPSVPLLQRYSTEAESGNIAADLIINAGGFFAEEGVKKGWLERITEAGIPVIASGEFPSKFNNGLTAIAGVVPWGFVYNTEKLKGADIPKDWPDLLNAKFRGQILLADPRSSDTYFDLWSLLSQKYGDSFFSRLRAQDMRQYPSAVPATQALGAGEGSLMLINLAPSALAYKKKGAPVDIITPDFTTGVEIHIMMTARAKAKHPNAARLLAHYVLSPEGNRWINNASISIFDSAELPKEYQSPTQLTPARREALVKLLGL